MNAPLRHFPPDSPERVSSALSMLDPTDRELWVKMSFAVKDALGDAGFEVWDAWSQRGANYNAGAAKATWRSASAGGKIRASSLFYEARQLGWRDDSKPVPVDPAELERQRAALEARRQAEAAQLASEHAEAAARAEQLWEAAAPASDDHPYLIEKKVRAYGLRVGPWTVTDRDTGEVRLISKQALLVPLQDRKRKLHGLQAIFASKCLAGRNKDYLAGAAKSGHFYAIGAPKEHKGRRVFVLTEGFATGATIHSATGHCVLVCFDAGNLTAVARSIHERTTEAAILLAADNDQWSRRADGTPHNPGISAAKKAAAEVGGLLAVPPFPASAGVAGEGGPTDFNDLAAAQGEDVVRMLIEAALDGSPVVPDPDGESGRSQEAEQERASDEAPWSDEDSLPYADPSLGPELYVDLEPGQELPPAEAPAHTLADSFTGSGLGFLPLGTLGESYLFWRKDTRSVEMIRAKDVSSDAAILRLADRQAWQAWCLGSSETGKYDRAVIANMLVQVSKRIGTADLGLVPESVASAQEVELAYTQALLHAKPSGGLLAQALAADDEWRAAGVWYDVFAGAVKVENEPPCGSVAGVWRDDSDVLLCGWASVRWGVNVSASAAAEAITALARRSERHPVRDYLQGLEWDGKPRLDTWLVDMAGAANNTYSRAVGAKTLIGAVARVMQPGCKLDTMLVLEGRQGLKKSSLIMALVPDLSWYTGNLGGDIGSKDGMAGLSGKWIIELAELANMRRSDVNHIKTFLSECVDHYRPSYGRRVMDFPRQSVLIGTINPEGDGAYLRDATGGRRFWPVECTRIDIERMKRERDQLWAEAVARYNAEPVWWLSQAEEALAAEVQSSRTEDNPWTYRVQKYLAYLPPHENGGDWGGKRASAPAAVLVADIFESFTGRAYTSRDLAESKAICEALKAAGWLAKNGYIDKRRCRFWYDPAQGEGEQAAQPSVVDDFPLW